MLRFGVYHGGLVQRSRTMTNGGKKGFITELDFGPSRGWREEPHVLLLLDLGLGQNRLLGRWV